MNNYVIAIEDNPRSVEIAKRCIGSAAQHGAKVEIFPAITPRNTDIYKLAEQEGISTKGFSEVYSRLDNCIAAFISHYSIWKLAAESYKPVTIFEHDAVIQSPIPRLDYIGCVNLGKPSYGIYQTPTKGLGRLQSMTHFPGTHCYRVNPYGAHKFVEQSKISGNTPDIFLHSNTFDFLEEYYPWPVISNDTFSTIQTKEGLRRKHSYKKNNLI